MPNFDEKTANTLLWELHDAWQDKRGGVRRVHELLDSLSVRCTALERGCSFTAMDGPPIPRIPANSVDVDQVVAMREQGMTYRMIAEELACSLSAVHRAAKAGERRGAANG